MANLIEMGDDEGDHGYLPQVSSVYPWVLEATLGDEYEYKLVLPYPSDVSLVKVWTLIFDPWTGKVSSFYWTKISRYGGGSEGLRRKGLLWGEHGTILGHRTALGREGGPVFPSLQELMNWADLTVAGSLMELMAQSARSNPQPRAKPVKAKPVRPGAAKPKSKQVIVEVKGPDYDYGKADLLQVYPEGYCLIQPHIKSLGGPQVVPAAWVFPIGASCG